MSIPPPPSAPPRAQRGDLGAVLLGLGALLLFISLFLHWYQPGRSAWTVFEVWDLVLAGCAAVAALAALGRLGIAPERGERWMTLPSAGAFVIVVASLLNHPPAATGDGPMIGIWLALVASIVMLAAVATSMARISLVIEMTEASRTRPGPATGLSRGHLRRRRSARRPDSDQNPAAPTSPAQDPAEGSAPPLFAPRGDAPSPAPVPPPQADALGPRPAAAPEAPLVFGADDPQSPASTAPPPIDPAEQPTQAHPHPRPVRDARARDEAGEDEKRPADD